MKHPKKKFKFQHSLNEEVIKKMEDAFDSIELNNLKKPPKGYEILVHTEDNTVISAFYTKINGNHYYIPEPDPILIYFNDAYSYYKEIDENKRQLLSDLNLAETRELYKQINQLYKFFGLCNGFVIFLFTSIETFINAYIPDKFEYKIARNSRTEIYNKEQIERQISFEEKYKTILKDISGKDFISKYPIKHQHIINLKEFRDSLVHMKTKRNSSTPYDYLYKKALNFNYHDTINAVKDYFNFYSPNYVEDCPCELDY